MKSMFNKPLNVFLHLHICWLLVVLIYVIDVGHIHGEDDNSKQVWVPKKCVQRIKSQNFKTRYSSYSLVLVGLYVYCHYSNVKHTF